MAEVDDVGGSLMKRSMTALALTLAVVFLAAFVESTIDNVR
jgi:hypothetical protein